MACRVGLPAFTLLRMTRLLAGIRFLIFLPLAPLVVLGSVLAMLLAPNYYVNPAAVPNVGVRWLRAWWSWVRGDITTWELVQ